MAQRETKVMIFENRHSKKKELFLSRGNFPLISFSKKLFAFQFSISREKTYTQYVLQATSQISTSLGLFSGCLSFTK